MIPKYHCEVCDKPYNTEEEALACEEKHKKIKEAELAKKSEKDKRSKQIAKLIEDFYNTYGEFPVISLSFSTTGNRKKLLDWLF